LSSCTIPKHTEASGQIGSASVIPGRTNSPERSVFTMRFAGPKNYGSFADFEREELRPMSKVGFNIDDLEAEATFTAPREDVAESAPDELDFD
jgi:hypothetical protein